MNFLEHLAGQEQGPSDVAFVVGAGQGADLPALRRLAFDRLILAEAHPRLAEDLQQRINPEAGEDVWPLAITPHPGEQVVLNVLNNTSHSSLKTLRGLLDHAPNLRVTTTVTVPARSLAQSIELLHLDAEKPNLLILDAPGLGLELMQSVPAHLLHLFSWIILHGGAIAHLHEDEGSLPDAADTLQNMGFDHVQDDPEAIYPHAAALLRRNDTRVAILERDARIMALQAELASTKSEADRVAMNFHARTETIQAEASRLNAERQTKIDALTQERDQQAKTVAEQKAQLEKITQDRDNQRKQAEEQKAQAEKTATEQKARLDALTQERDTLRTQAEEHKTLAGKTAAERDKLAKTLVEQREEVRRKDARIAQLDAGIKELEQRQVLMNEEMVRAEGQIELIKDLLLREQGL